MRQAETQSSLRPRRVREHEAPGFLRMGINFRDSKEGWKVSKEKQ